MNYYLIKYLFVFVIGILLLSACATHTLTNDGNTTRYKNVAQYFNKSEVLQDHLTGFCLYDRGKNTYVFQQNENKFFTPASNTKLWTLAAAMAVLGDSIAWMSYEDVHEKRVFFPMGDPTFLHPFMKDNERISTYFSTHFNAGDTVYLSTEHFRDVRFGEGWMWDDRSYYFQPEKSVFPIHANNVKLIPRETEVDHEPKWMNIFSAPSDHPSRFREEYQNVFIIPKGQDYPSYMPMVIDSDFYRSFFNSMNLHVEFVDRPYDAKKVQTIYSRSSPEVYKYFMEESDNLIAEQLLLQCSMEKLGYMNTKDLIDTLMHVEFSQWNDSWNWYDGSGISRYNLVTPTAMLTLMNSMLDTYDQDELERTLPSGGEGTLEKWYGYDPPRVFAKTGTVKYCHNLTGLIHTNKGNQYTFSFMHNNFNYSSSVVKEAMSDVIDIIVELY